VPKFPCPCCFKVGRYITQPRCFHICHEMLSRPFFLVGLEMCLRKSTIQQPSLECCRAHFFWWVWKCVFANPPSSNPVWRPSGQSDKMSRACADSEIHKSCASVFTYLIYVLEMCLNFQILSSRTYIPFGKTCDETDTYMVPLRMPCDVTGWCGGPKPCDSDVVYFETKEHLSVYRWSWIGGVCMFFFVSGDCIFLHTAMTL